MKKQIIAVIALTVTLIGGFFWYIMDDNPNISKTVKEQVPDRTMSYSDNVLKEEKNGKLVWEMTAEGIEVDLESNHVTLKSLKGTFYRENGVVTELTAEEGAYDQTKGLITMKGAIKANESDGAMIKADAARYDSKKKHLYCDGNVEVKKDGYLVTGDHMLADQVSGKIRVDGNAHAIQIGE